jgi:hypothetical protein
LVTLSILARPERRHDEGPKSRAAEREDTSVMSQYLLLIYQDEAAYVNADEETLGAMHAGHGAFWGKHESAISGGNALTATTTATTIRPNGNEFTVTDGPFAETKEVLGGYYLVEAADLDAAIAIAKDIPSGMGCIEIRPINVLLNQSA